MFGLAIWDVDRRRLVVARDAMGIKLVYYRIADGRLTFGSEIRAVQAAADSEPEVDPFALSLFLRFRYTPSPFTIFKGIRKLAPGTMLVAEDGRCREERWYNYTPVPFETAKQDEEATQELLELYRGAVKRHLLSDVPVGILLSGGLDSGLLLALMNEHGRDWPAYTVGYGESFEDDELTDAAETAALLGARHVPVKLDREEFERSLPKIVRMSGRADHLVVRRPYVFCLPAGPPRREGGLDRSGAGRVVWRLQTPSWAFNMEAYGADCPQACVDWSAPRVNRLPRNETLKRGIQSLGIERPAYSATRDIFSLAPVETNRWALSRWSFPSTDRDDSAECLARIASADGAHRRIGRISTSGNPLLASRRVADVRGQAFHGSQSGGSCSLPGPDRGGVCAAAGRVSSKSAMAKASGCIGRSATLP